MERARVLRSSYSYRHTLRARIPLLLLLLLPVVGWIVILSQVHASRPIVFGIGGRIPSPFGCDITDILRNGRKLSQLQFIRGGSEAETSTPKDKEDDKRATCLASENEVIANCGVSKAIVVRIRLPNGTVERVAINTNLDQVTIGNVLATVLSKNNLHQNENIVIRKVDDGSLVTDMSQSLADLDINHGTLLTIMQSKATSSQHSENDSQSYFVSSKKRNNYDPFPSLAKDYPAALIQYNRRAMHTKVNSYASLTTLHTAMHIVEPQSSLSQGKLRRVYMCPNAAQMFQQSQCDCALLLGTIHTESIGTTTKSALPKTTLSSPTNNVKEYGQVAKIHAIWIPSTSSSSTTTSTSTLPNRERLLQENIPISVWRVANALEIVPVGWIFSYNETIDHRTTTTTSSSSSSSLPVWATDIIAGAQQQISHMRFHSIAATATIANKNNHYKMKQKQPPSDPGAGVRYVTLAMDTCTGATEAFQWSDQVVQMVAEDILTVVKDGEDQSQRYCPTKYPIVVNGKETKEMDCVLGLVNTALLSHKGRYTSSSSQLTIKPKDGTLTTKTRKKILKALLLQSNDATVLSILCDFHTLVAIDELLRGRGDNNNNSTGVTKVEQDGSNDLQELCTAVHKYAARGLTKTTTISPTLKQTLRQLLESK